MRVRSRWLAVARVAWVVVTLFALGIFVFSVSFYWVEIQRVCVESAQECSDRGLLTQENVQRLERLGPSVSAYSAFVITLRIVSLSVWVIVGAVIFWRRSGDLMALLAASTLVTFGTSFQSFSYGTSFGFGTNFLEGLSVAYPPLLSPLIDLLAALGFTTLILFIYLFPDGRFVPRWTFLPAIVWVVNDWGVVFFPELWTTHRWISVAGFASFLVGASCAVGAQIYRYLRTSTQAQRQQTRWVIFGISVGLGGFLVLVVLEGVFAGFDRTSVLGGLFAQTVITVLFAMIPISVGVAILRSRLYDIDVVINRALVYGALTISLVGTYLSSVILLQYALRSITGEDSQLAIVASTLAIAALFNPLRRRIQEIVDRRFYRQKYDARLTLEVFSVKLRDETNLEHLADDLLLIVRETMRPEHAGLWLRQDFEVRDAGEDRAG